MGRSMSVDKGKRAEREIVKLLQPVVIDIYLEHGNGRMIPSLERNLMQSHRGGQDLVGLDWLAIEVKHQEELNLNTWWQQTKTQGLLAENKLGRTVEPVLFYRRNGVKFKVRMFGYLAAGKTGRVRCPVDISVEAFLTWFKLRLVQEITA